MRLASITLFVMAACGRDTILVNDKPSGDYKHTELISAVNRFVAGKRSPAAYGELAATVFALRPAMDKAVGKEAELKLVTLALAPIQQMQDKEMSEKLDALALTVWPALLAPPIEADTQLSVRDPKAADVLPKPGETADQYLERICGDVLTRDCKRVVPELQGAVVESLAIRRATERARAAVAECLACANDDAWKQIVAGWERLDRELAQGIPDVERRADPDNWPIAGGAADDDPGVPEAELSMRGDLVVEGHSYGPNQQRIDVLKELRGDGELLALHLHPDTTLAQARAILVDVRKSGAKRVAVIAREGVYPYRRKAYWVAVGDGLRANLRPTDSLQLLLHAVDEVAGPGTVARID